MLSPRVPVTVQRRLLAGVGVSILPPRAASIEHTTLGGRPCEVVTMPCVAKTRSPMHTLRLTFVTR